MQDLSQQVQEQLSNIRDSTRPHKTEISKDKHHKSLLDNYIFEVKLCVRFVLHEVLFNLINLMKFV